MARKVLRGQDQDAPEPERRYPVCVEEFAGNGRVVELVGRALGRGALAPSLLLTGPAGVGKGTLARMIAAALLCESPTPTACGVCLPCRKMAKGIHPDFRELAMDADQAGKAKPQFRVDAIRQQIVQSLTTPPYEGKKLIFLIDPAEALMEASQNSLLKSLEEPPAYGQFILVTASPWKLLPTVHSRCQRLGLSRLSPAEMAKWMEGRATPPGEDFLLMTALGRPGACLDFDPAAFRKRRRDLLDLVEFGMDASRAGALIRSVDKLSKDRPAQLPAEISTIVVDAARALEGLPPRLHADAGSDLFRAGRARGRDGLRILADKLSEAPVFLNHNVSVRLLLEWLFLCP